MPVDQFPVRADDDLAGLRFFKAEQVVLEHRVRLHGAAEPRVPADAVGHGADVAVLHAKFGRKAVRPQKVQDVHRKGIGIGCARFLVRLCREMQKVRALLHQGEFPARQKAMLADGICLSREADFAILGRADEGEEHRRMPRPDVHLSRPDPHLPGGIDIGTKLCAEGACAKRGAVLGNGIVHTFLLSGSNPLFHSTIKQNLRQSKKAARRLLFRV